MFDLLEARPIYDLRGHEKGVSAVTFSAKGDYMASGGQDNYVFVWKTNIAEETEEEGAAREPGSRIRKETEAVKKDIEKAEVLKVLKICYDDSV